MFLRHRALVTPTLLDLYKPTTSMLCQKILLKMKLGQILFFIQSTFSKPNVILLIADDLGNGDISLNNKLGKIDTPNIDRIGREGIL